MGRGAGDWPEWGRGVEGWVAVVIAGQTRRRKKRRKTKGSDREDRQGTRGPHSRSSLAARLADRRRVPWG